MDIWFIHVHSNLRLGDKISSVNNTETTVEWEQWAVWTSDYGTDNQHQLQFTKTHVRRMG